MNKSVLLISYYYPPLAGIGSLRTLKFAQYLPSLDWKPLVLTPCHGEHVYRCDPSEGDLPGVEVIRTGYFDVPSQLKSVVGLKRGAPVSQQAKVFEGRPPLPGLARHGLEFVKNILLFPDAQIGWYRAAVRDGLAAIRKYRPDVIFSTSPPVTSHLIARHLKRLTGIPWVADLRDLWSDNHQNFDRPWWRLFLEARTEKFILSGADGLVTVSDTFAHLLSSRLGIGNGWQVVIANGFDPGDYPADPPHTQEKFTISHMGDLWSMTRNPGPVFEALSRLAGNGTVDSTKLELRFYGLPDKRQEQALKELAVRTGLAHCTRVFDAVSYGESLAIQQQSTLLLVLEILTEKGKGVVAGKIFEHFGARRPVLALVPDGGEVQRLLGKTGAGEAFDPRLGRGPIENLLARCYQEWENTGTVAFHGRDDLIKGMTRQQGAQHLASFLDDVRNRGSMTN